MAKKEVKSNKWVTGTVHWYDPISGEGMIRSDSGELFYVHCSAIDQFTKEKNAKKALLKENQKVKFTLLQDPSLKQINKLKDL